MYNKTHISEEKYNELHHQLAQIIIDFFKKEGLPEDAHSICIWIDQLKESVEYGEWHPYSDSGLEVFNYDRDLIYYTT